MSLEENKALIRQWAEVWNQGNLDAVGEFVSDTYVRHDPNTPEVRGPEEEKQLMAMYLSAFPTSTSPSRTWSPRGTRS